MIDGDRYRAVAVPVQNGDGQALILAQSLKSTDQMLDRLGLVMLLFGLAGIISAALAGLGRGAQRAATGTPPDHRRRGHRAHRAARPDPGRGTRRGGPAGHGVQRDAHRTVRLPGTAAAAGRRRRPRAAYAADLPAHQPRPARPGRQLGQALRAVPQGAARRRARPDRRDDHPHRRPGRAGPRRPLGRAAGRARRARRRGLPGSHARTPARDHRAVRRTHRALVGHRRLGRARAGDHQPARQRRQVEPGGRPRHRRAEQGHRHRLRPGPGHRRRRPPARLRPLLPLDRVPQACPAPGWGCRS